MAKPSNKKNKQVNQDNIEPYEHQYQDRPNNPQVGMVTSSNDADVGKKKYEYDPHLDPSLNWSGKKEQQDIEVDTVSIHVHERIDPKTIISSMQKQKAENYQASLFEQDFNKRPLHEEVSFYQHKNAWVNRLIAGDSLLVMNSLLEKESMAGSVQMIYIDPPYGIKYGSNFQPYTNQTQVVDGKDSDLNVEPEMIKAFRDTWELGIHSYLSYMRDRLLLAKELLKDSGSCFVQISDENVHHVRELMDEVFGAENFCSIITFVKTSGFAAQLLSNVGDYVIWYAKNKPKVKYRQLYKDKQEGRGIEYYTWLELVDGTRRRLTATERQNFQAIPKGARLFRLSDMHSQGESKTEQGFMFEGQTYHPRKGSHWKTTIEGLAKLASKRRLVASNGVLQFVRYLDDYPVTALSNIWDDTATGSFTDPKIYVVQTGTKTISRCILMSTDPADLVLDITCGSGTTAYASEMLGRRWITVDTSRIAIQLTRQRLLTSTFNWYELAQEDEGVLGGFLYAKASHVTLGAIAKDEPTLEEVLYDKPLINKNIVRVTGPFTVEAIPAATTKPLQEITGTMPADSSVVRTGETVRQDVWRNELLKTGIRTKGGEKLELVRIEILAGARHLHAQAETSDGKKILISFGPEHAPLEQTQVEHAFREAETYKPSPDIILFAAFQFDPEAAKDIDEVKWPGVNLLKIQINADLLTDDLKKGRSGNESFWLLGQPDIQVKKQKDGQFIVSVEGFDYYDPSSGEVQSGGKQQIAAWMLDTDYNERSIFPTQIFLPMANAQNGWQKLAKTLKAELDEDLLQQFQGTVSLPFTSGKHKSCAIKIIDNRGIEYFCVRSLE